MERFDCRLIELKLAAGADAEMAFSGYGAVFGNVDSYGDVIAKGAFAETIREAKSSDQWPSMLLQHGGWGISADDMTPIGVWTSMKEDDIGLALEGKLAPTPRGVEMYTLMKMAPRPAINGLSIGYVPIKWKMRSTPEEPRRTLEQVKLMEISPVTFPANGKARVRDVKSGEFSEREFERLLMQDAGFSRSEARLIINQGFKSFAATQDAGDGGMQQLAEKFRTSTRFTV
jgi:HK97 family phage prohead protease